MDYVIGILSEKLTRLENAWIEFVTSGKVSEDSSTAKQKAKEINELKTAIKILTTDVETGENNCTLHNVMPSFDDEEEEDFEEEEEPDFYVCMCCGNVQQSGMTCSKCCGPTTEGYT